MINIFDEIYILLAKKLPSTQINDYHFIWRYLSRSDNLERSFRVIFSQYYFYSL